MLKQVISNHENARAYPCYYGSLERLANVLGKDKQDTIKQLSCSLRDESQLLDIGVLTPVLPSCLSMVDIRTDSGKKEAADILLSHQSMRLPREILYRNGMMRVDLNRFRDFKKYMEERNTDFIFGELNGTENNWVYNCYVSPKDSVFTDELPVITIYGSSKLQVGLWYVGYEGDLVMFMSSAINIPYVVNQGKLVNKKVKLNKRR